jgi:hypothetical protein
MIPPDFNRVIKDFIRDIVHTYPELESTLQEDVLRIHMNELTSMTPELQGSFMVVYEHVLRILPTKFFDILYEKAEVFQEPCLFLPGIDFKQLWIENITEKTKNSIWKYLKLVLLMIIGNGKQDSTMFDNVNMEDLKSKIDDTLKDIHSFFDKSEIPNTDEMKEHLDGLMQGKIGKLAKEIAEESIGDNADDAFKTMFKDPSKMVGLMHNIGDKIDKKIKSGDLKESELMAEAVEMLSKMKTMPGMKNFEQMFNKFGGKMDINAMQNQLNTKLNQSKTKERLQSKLKEKQKSVEQVEKVEQPQEPEKKKKKKKKKNRENIHDPILDKRSDNIAE